MNSIARIAKNEALKSQHSGMGMVHQQFLHVLGLAGEHQRSDAGTHITVQPTNLNLDAAQISGKFI